MEEDKDWRVAWEGFEEWGGGGAEPEGLGRGPKWPSSCPGGATSSSSSSFKDNQVMTPDLLVDLEFVFFFWGRCVGFDGRTAAAAAAGSIFSQICRSLLLLKKLNSSWSRSFYMFGRTKRAVPKNMWHLGEGPAPFVTSQLQDRTETQLVGVGNLRISLVCWKEIFCCCFSLSGFKQGGSKKAGKFLVLACILLSLLLLTQLWGFDFMYTRDGHQARQLCSKPEWQPELQRKIMIECLPPPPQCLPPPQHG